MQSGSSGGKSDIFPKQESAKEQIQELEYGELLNSLLVENEGLLIEIQAQSEHRKNKNAVSPKMSLLTNKFERNLMRICKMVPPSALGDPIHIGEEKDRFLKFYNKRNNKRVVLQSNGTPSHQTDSASKP